MKVSYEYIKMWISLNCKLKGHITSWHLLAAWDTCWARETQVWHSLMGQSADVSHHCYLWITCKYLPPSWQDVAVNTNSTGNTKYTLQHSYTWQNWCTGTVPGNTNIPGDINSPGHTNTTGNTNTFDTVTYVTPLIYLATLM